MDMGLATPNWVTALEVRSTMVLIMGDVARRLWRQTIPRHGPEGAHTVHTAPANGEGGNAGSLAAVMLHGRKNCPAAGLLPWSSAKGIFGLGAGLLFRVPVVTLIVRLRPTQGVHNRRQGGVEVYHQVVDLHVLGPEGRG